MDLSKYKGLYLQETGDHLSGIESGLLALEKAPDPSVVDTLFRHYHSIKGMSASMGYTPIMKLAHAQEDLLDKVRSKKIALSAEATSLLLKCLDLLRSLVKKVEDDEPVEADIEPFIGQLKKAAEGASASAAAPIAAVAAVAPAAQERKPEVEGLKLSNVMKVDGKVFDGLLATVGELFMALSSFKGLMHSNRSIELKDGVYMLGKTVGRLHESILTARMLPIEDLTANLPRLIRDLARDTGKEVALNIEGADISLDRAILEGLGSPMIHIIRNAVDHGIEPASERNLSGKPSVATIRIRAYTKKGRVMIEISDDGRGINREALKRKALSRGFAAEKVNSMTDKEVLRLICLPGLSTAESVTSTSGRGVGMDVVKDVVEGFGGSLEIDSTPGKGTRIVMALPRTTSITKALLVCVGDERFLIPLSRIEKVVEVYAPEIEGNTYRLNEETVPIVHLAAALGLPEKERLSYTVIVVEGGGPNSHSPSKDEAGQSLLAGVLVDDFGDEIDAYVKPLLPPISRLWGASGITIMGDGRPVFLLDVPQIIQKTMA